MNKIKKTLYWMTRPLVKNHLTGNLGKVVEDDEKLTCYVRKHKIRRKDYHYTIPCSGIDEKQKKLAEAYNLNKPICYVIDGIEFKHTVYIFGYNNCEIVVKNCKLGITPTIRVNGKCTVENSNIITFSYLSLSANELVIKNMDLDQIRIVSKESTLGFGGVNKIDIINSNIGSKDKDVSVSMLTKNKINIINSNIYGEEIICESNEINVDEKSTLNGNQKVVIKTKEFNQINVNTPVIFLNGEEIPNERQVSTLTKIKEPLALKRLELVTLLKKIKNKCENIQTEKISRYEENLNRTKVRKILKK